MRNPLKAETIERISAAQTAPATGPEFRLQLLNELINKAGTGTPVMKARWQDEADMIAMTLENEKAIQIAAEQTCWLDADEATMDAFHDLFAEIAPELADEITKEVTEIAAWVSDEISIGKDGKIIYTHLPTVEANTNSAYMDAGQQLSDYDAYLAAEKAYAYDPSVENRAARMQAWKKVHPTASPYHFQERK